MFGDDGFVYWWKVETLKPMDEHTEAKTKWTPFFRRRFQMDFGMKMFEFRLKFC